MSMRLNDEEIEAHVFRNLDARQKAWEDEREGSMVITQCSDTGTVIQRWAAWWQLRFQCRNVGDNEQALDVVEPVWRGHLATTKLNQPLAQLQRKLPLHLTSRAPGPSEPALQHYTMVNDFFKALGDFSHPMGIEFFHGDVIFAALEHAELDGCRDNLVNRKPVGWFQHPLGVLGMPNTALAHGISVTNRINHIIHDEPTGVDTPPIRIKSRVVALVSGFLIAGVGVITFAYAVKHGHVEWIVTQ